MVDVRTSTASSDCEELRRWYSDAGNMGLGRARGYVVARDGRPLYASASFPGTHMTTAEVLAFMRTQKLAVEASVSAARAAQAAVVGIAVTDALEIVFDTLDSTRKVANLRGNPRLAFVIGGATFGDERTVQYEGMADEPKGAERDRIVSAYYRAWPDGPSRASWPGLTYVRVRPMWIRYSDFNQSPPLVVEFDERQLAGASAPLRR